MTRGTVLNPINKSNHAVRILTNIS